MTGVDLRPAAPADEPFLRDLMTRAIADELGAWAWPQEIRAQLLETQYRVRDEGMRSTWRDLDDRIVLHDQRPVGRLAVARTADEIWIVDLLISSERRGAGLGTAVLTMLLEEGSRSGKPVRVNIDTTRRATHLYERLGFAKVGGSEVHHLIEWAPAQLKISMAN